MDEIELLTGVLAGTGDLIEGVGDDQWSRPTPCPDYDVSALVDHILGWVQVFAAGANGTNYEGDPAAHRRGPDPAGEFRAVAAGVVAGWRENGFDRQVSLLGGEAPAPSVFNMTLMEYMVHGWDLATATGQTTPYTEEQAVETLARAEATLPPQNRGNGTSFGPVVDVPDTAPAVDRLAGFLGRTP